MDNQHQKIKGYRDLTQEEIDLMNEVKALESKVGQLIKKLRPVEHIDARCLSVARTDLQKGFMFLVRSIAKPESDL